MRNRRSRTRVGKSKKSKEDLVSTTNERPPLPADPAPTNLLEAVFGSAAAGFLENSTAVPPATDALLLLGLTTSASGGAQPMLSDTVLSASTKGAKRKQPSQPRSQKEDSAPKRSRFNPASGTDLLALASDGTRNNDNDNDDDENNGGENEGHDNEDEEEEEEEDEGDDAGETVISGGLLDENASRKKKGFRRRRFCWTAEEDHHILLVAAACLDHPLA
jgi:hypothetical protein